MICYVTAKLGENIYKDVQLRLRFIVANWTPYHRTPLAGMTYLEAVKKKKNLTNPVLNPNINLCNISHKRSCINYDTFASPRSW